MKKIFSLLIVFALLAFVAIPVVAKGPSAPAGKSNKAHLYLYQKDPSTWEIVEKGGWGKMTYDLSGPEFNYVFNGHNLMAEEDYTLIYYPDPWPGTGLKCLGSGVADSEKNIHLQGKVDTGDLPIKTDLNERAKIWLVKSGDVDCRPVGWSVVGTYRWSVMGSYFHDVTIDTQNSDGTFSGTAGYPSGSSPWIQPNETTETITGRVDGDTITFTTDYNGPYNPSYSVTVTGKIASDGTISGTDPWSWSMDQGKATSIGSRMIGWHPTNYLFEETLINFNQTE